MSAITFLIAQIAIFSAIAEGQAYLNPPGTQPHLKPSDEMLFASSSPHSDIACVVTPVKPKLELDFQFHSGFRVSIPARDLELDRFQDRLTVVFRVIPERSGDPVYMFEQMRIPTRGDAPKGTIEFDGSFLLREGRYHVDWILRNRSDHVCTSSWDIEAKLGPKETQLKAWTGSASIKPVESDLFAERTPPILREPDPVNVDVIANFGPRDPSLSVIDPIDVQGVVSILRQLGRDPTVNIQSSLACSIVGHRILQELTSGGIDFRAVGASLKALKLGVVDAKELGTKDSAAMFAARVIHDVTLNSNSEALIVVGPRMNVEAGAREISEALKDSGRPVFYLSYDSGSLTIPWRDSLGRGVKQAHGIEYGISTPLDLFSAWSDVLTRILKARRQVHSGGGNNPPY